MNTTLILIICGIVLAVAFCFCLAIANFAPERFFEIYKETNKTESYCRLSPLELVNQINKKEFGGKIRLHKIDKLAGDAYVRGGDLLLSQSTLSSTSLASYAVLAHEFGHAMQDRDSNKLKTKSLLNRIGGVIGVFMFPAFIAAIVLIAFGGPLVYWGVGLAVFGGLIFLFSLFMRLMTISIEKEASKNAIGLLEEYFDEKQLKIMKKLLDSAKLTYWAAFFRTLFVWTMFTQKTKLFN